MSRFRAAIQAIRGPLEFMRDGGRRLERVRDGRATLLGALERAASLEIPPDARRRLRDAGALLRSGELDAGLASRVAARLGPLLGERYPLAVLAQSPDRLPGVGPKIAGALVRKEIHTVEDVLFFLPRSYEDRRQLVSIEALEVGHSACFEGTVMRAAVVPLRNGRRFFEAVVADGTGAVQLKWFRGVPQFRERIRPGLRVLVAGEVRRYRYAKELHHPEIELLAEDAAPHSLPRIVPVYSVVEGVPPRTLRRVIQGAVAFAADLVDAYLPEDAATRLGLPPVGAALAEVHCPGPHQDPGLLRERRTPYHLRLAAEELFLLQAGLGIRRERLARRVSKPLDVRGAAVRRALASLPFKLTPDQRRAWREIASDLGRAQPMNRLLVGDVGTGKTVLALLGAVAAHASGGLTAVLAPTEILAEQHAQTFGRLAHPLGLRSALLTGSTPAAERRRISLALRQREVEILVGTHALLSGSLELPGLCFVVIDEQHRFGVVQRQLMVRKGDSPHVLALSATPIPRTLALTLFGDLEHSVLRCRPAGRVPVATRVVPPSAGRAVLQEIRHALDRGEQVYVVYPLVEESEKQDLRDATRGFERLRDALPGARVALLHGRLDSRERERVMREFEAGELQVLVATTVIEVGVDVHGATLLVVQHAERFGLAQLHQLRGRVGRGERPGTAILFADPKSEEASRRLAILERSDSGFEIAEEDLRIRGAGEWLGKRQAGHLPELRLADLVGHAELLPPVREAARHLARGDPELDRHPELRAGIERRWGRRLDLGAVT